MVQKALGISADIGSQAPADKQGGAALTLESVEPKKEKKKKKLKLRKMDKTLYKSNLVNVLYRLQNLYPENSRSELWEALKERLHKKFDI